MGVVVEMLESARIFIIFLVATLYINTLYTARENGFYCKKDHKCSSRHCCVTRCRDCCKDSHCNKGQKCGGNVCLGPKPNGHTCLADSDCRTKHCCGVVGEKICRDCCLSSHCGKGEECKR